MLMTSHASPSFRDAIAKRATLRIADFNCRELANTVCARAKIGHASSAFFDVITEVTKVSLKAFDVFDMGKSQGFDLLLTLHADIEWHKL
eukprot:163161-Karenia_brevis.AAC.1